MGKCQRKWQLSNKGKRKVRWAAERNAAPERRGTTQHGMGRKERATHDVKCRVGPAGGWHKGDSLMPQRDFCEGTGWGWDLCSACGWVTGVLWSLGKPGSNPAVSRKSLQKLPLAFIGVAVQWRFHTLGIWLIKVKRSGGWLNVFHGQLWVPDLQETHERQDSGLERRHSLRHNDVPCWVWEPYSAASKGCQCHLPSTLDSQGAVRPPGADLEKRDKQGSTVLPMGLMKLRSLIHALKQFWVSQGERRQQSSILGSQAPAWE